MPYIKQEKRDDLRTAVDKGRLPANAGDLKYVLKRHVLDYIQTKGGILPDVLRN